MQNEQVHQAQATIMRKIAGDNNPLVDCPLCKAEYGCKLCLDSGKISELKYMIWKITLSERKKIRVLPNTPQIDMTTTQKPKLVEWEKGVVLDNE